MGRMLLPPGFRFHPTDMELIMYYLKRKVMGKKLIFDAVTELNIYKFAPWDLPDKCLWKSKDLEWYFFCPREKKYSSGARSNRATEIGYWKITGKDRLVTYNQRTVGRIKTLIFYTGHAPQGERTDWVMHEYRLEDKNLVDVIQDAYMLCKIFQKSGLGPKNGEQHGAPFNEEEWSDMEEISVESPPVACQIFSNSVPPSYINNSNAASLSVPGDSLVNFMPEPDRSANEPRHIDIQPGMKEICVEKSAVDHHILPNYVPPGTIGSSAAVCMTDPGNSHVWPTSTSGPSPDGPLVMDMPDNPSDPDKDILELLNMFTEDINLPPAENNVMEKFERNGHLPQFDENSIYNGLGDLNDGIELRDFGFNISTTQDAAFNPNPVLMGEEDTPFLELNDLSIPLQCPFEIGELDWKRTGSIYAAPTYGMSIGMDEFYSGCANPCSAEVSRWNDYSALLERPHLVGNNLELGKDNCMLNFEAHGCDAVTGNEVPFSVAEPDGSGTAEQIQRRGEQQTNLQLLLDSVSAHMIRAEQLIDSLPQSGSSIRFKAEVTLMVGECTKDALLHNMEESDRISISWGSQPIGDVSSSRQYILYVLFSCFWMILGKLWILLIPEMPFFFDSLLICMV